MNFRPWPGRHPRHHKAPHTSESRRRSKRDNRRDRPLGLPLDQPDPPLFGRKAYRHRVYPLNRNENGRRTRRFPSASVDSVGPAVARSLSRVRLLGRPDRGSDRRRETWASTNWAEHGIAGRGVRADVADSFDAVGPQSLSADRFAYALQCQSVSLQTAATSCACGPAGSTATGA